ncbi:MAG: rhomboid family intramembrane serine protease [Halobacteriaceae archaeon]
MARCDRCGSEVPMPYQCRLCGGTFCSEHRLPENHGCPGLDDWNDPGGVFDSGFDDSVGDGESGALTDRLSLDVNTGPGGPLAYFRNVTYTFLLAMWLVFVAELVIVYVLGDVRLFQTLFVLRSSHVAYVWTWVTSVFSHSPVDFFHIVFNSIVLYFFGPVVEKRIGSRKFAALFLVAGMAAGLAQVVVGILLGAPVSGVLGASGAIAAVLGVLTVLNPNLRIYLYFIIPMPLWVATGLFALYSVLASTVGGIGFGSVAQVAHLAGLGIGLLYGLHLKQRGERGPQRLEFGGGGPGGPGRGRF